MSKQEIENLIRESMYDFISNLKFSKWTGKEYEAVSFFAFSSLLKRIKICFSLS